MLYTIQNQEIKKFLYGLVIVVFALASVFSVIPALVARADDITYTDIKANPNSGTVNVGQNLEILFHQLNNMDDITTNGSCTVNGKEVGPLQNLGEGDYKLVYTVAEGDTSRDAGQVPISCNLTNTAGLQDTITAFTDNNTVAISGTTNSNNGNNNGGNGNGTTTDNNNGTTTDNGRNNNGNNNNNNGGNNNNNGGNNNTGTTTGNINGDVQNSSNGNNGVLSVSSIEQVRSTAVADGSFENGWKWIFHITVPSNEPSLQLKFDNWNQTGGSGSIGVANNMRISSSQAASADTILISAPDVYTIPLNITGDLNSSLAGRQVDVTVEMAVPAGSTNGTYSTAYHVKSSQ